MRQPGFQPSITVGARLLSLQHGAETPGNFWMASVQLGQVFFFTFSVPVCSFFSPPDLLTAASPDYCHQGSQAVLTSGDIDCRMVEGGTPCQSTCQRQALYSITLSPTIHSTAIRLAPRPCTPLSVASEATSLSHLIGMCLLLPDTDCHMSTNKHHVIDEPY